MGINRFFSFDWIVHAKDIWVTTSPKNAASGTIQNPIVFFGSVKCDDSAISHEFPFLSKLTLLKTDLNLIYT